LYNACLPDLAEIKEKLVSPKYYGEVKGCVREAGPGFGLPGYKLLCVYFKENQLKKQQGSH
jgi:hypothetical protein